MGGGHHDAVAAVVAMLRTLGQTAWHTRRVSASGQPRRDNTGRLRRSQPIGVICFSHLRGYMKGTADEDKYREHEHTHGRGDITKVSSTFLL